MEATTDAEDPRSGDAGLDPLLDVAGRGVRSGMPETRQPARLILPPRPRQSGVKAVLARLPMFDPGRQVPDRLASLVTALKRDSPKVDVKAVLRAYGVADAAHEGQCRKSGEPFIMHPIGVAEVLAELRMDTSTICAALLHDTVEDTDLTLDDIARGFGKETALLVDGVTKLDRLQFASKEARQAESLRKMLLAMASDVRVLVIKLADRLHNMRTIHHMPCDSQKRIAQETLRIYAPLAHRLGMQNFRWELEDLSFATLHPKRYDEIKAMVADRQPERDRYLDKVRAEVEERLRIVKIRADVNGRPKHYWSIYEKMFMRGKEFAEIYDLVGIRVIVDLVKDCYAALGTVHAMWRPIPGRFKDYIAMPKFNLYQSLHTTVVGPDGKPLEVQIRTAAMHQIAEYGIAAHWKYKEARASGDDIAPPTDVWSEAQWLSQMLQMQSDTKDSVEFMRNVRGDLQADEVFVFTPKGEIKALPRTSTPVDFAYAIHTDVGNRTIGARVNERLVPLDYELRNGDTVEILTSTAQGAGPSRDWLGFVGSSRARSKIKHWFAHERRVDAIDKGHDELRQALAKKGQGWKRHMDAAELDAVAEALHYANLDALYQAIGDGHRSAQSVVVHLSQRITDDSDQLGAPLPSPQEPPARSSDAVVVQDTDNSWVTLARCCSPVPYDRIIGLTTNNRGVSVHRSNCPNAEDLSRDPQRLVQVHWDTRAPATFRVNLQVEALDRKRLLRDITTVLGDLQVNLLSAQLTTQRNRVAQLRFTFELADIAHLQHIIAQVRRVESVFDTYRIVPRPNEEQPVS